MLKKHAKHHRQHFIARKEITDMKPKELQDHWQALKKVLNLAKSLCSNKAMCVVGTC